MGEDNFNTFKLKSDANNDFDTFDTDIDMVRYGGTLFDRIINYRDITQIRLEYEDNSSKEFTIEWEEEDDNEYQNKLQLCKITTDGSLFVCVPKLKFDLEKGEYKKIEPLPGPAIFFYINGKFEFYTCELDAAEWYGDFLIYPMGHFDLWNNVYIKKYGVDYDYFPRGRVAYNIWTDTYEILYDRCIDEDDMAELVETHYKDKIIYLNYDEHYQCHICNKEYVI